MPSSPDTLYHRWLGHRAPALLRLALASGLGLIVSLVLSFFVTWQVAVLCGWDIGAAMFLAVVLSIVVRADGPLTQSLVTRDDQSRESARLLVLGACVASLIAVAFTLGSAKRESGDLRVLLITVATVTVVLSWTVVNTVFTLRYAHLHYREPRDEPPQERVDFGGATASTQPDLRDFAYLAFTIGMTYQVSDTTLRDHRIRRAVLYHAFLAYVFGVVIVATVVNVVAGLVG